MSWIKKAEKVRSYGVHLIYDIQVDAVNGEDASNKAMEEAAKELGIPVEKIATNMDVKIYGVY